ncbi:MAG: DUF429 domain-containing protein [Infirmifilum uzonense]|uniref:DUF429 domain-containing protein n=1 Tax=Infirmifilum uzonense TaxID=1550241 RepID=UPI002351FD1B
MLYAGIDLTASKSRPTCIAFLDNEKNVRVYRAFDDLEILHIMFSLEPDIVGIDSPLTYPKQGRLRGCERIMRELGIKFFPPSLPAMKKLMYRGSRLAEALSRRGIKVLEVYPGGTQDVLCLPRKRRSLDELRKGLEKLGLHIEDQEKDGDVLDAVTAAYTVYVFARGDYLRLISEDCELILPVPICLPRTPNHPYWL